MPVIVEGGNTKSSHSFSITGLDANGNSLTVGLTPVDNKGKDSIHAVRYSGYPVGTLRGETGDGEFSLKRKPYGEFSRRDWVGGIGELNGLTDAKKYWFGKRVWSCVKERMMLEPRLFRASLPYPVRTGNEDTLNHPITWVSVAADFRVAWSVTCAYAGTGVDLLLRTLVDNDFTLNIRADSAGSPGAVVDTVSFTDSVIGSNRYQFEKAIAASTFWIEILGTAAFEIGTSDQTDYTCMTSDDAAATWDASAMDAPVFFIMSATGANEWVFFDYRWGKYAVSGNRLFLNGDRGACDDNSGNLNLVVDATKSWTVNQFAGATVKLTNAALGWRKIISNDGTSLTVDRAFPSALTTDDWYVIQGAEVWTEITGHGLTNVTDAVALREETVYFAQGPDVQMRRMREYNNSGTWTREFDEDTQSVVGGALPGANFLCPVYDQVDGPVIYKVVNGDLGFIAKAPAVTWGTDLTFGTEIKIGSDNWEDLTGAIEYDGKLAVTAMDSVWMVKNGVAEKVSIDMQKQWTANTGRRPCVVPPYLVFPFGNRAQRLYSSIVESFGPERDSGVPKRYDGKIMDNLALVGGLAIAKDGGKIGEYPTDAEGGAFLYREGGWHPLAFTGVGSAMRGISYQHSEDEMDLIWFGDHNGLWYMYVPRSWNYNNDPLYSPTNRVEHDGWFISGWFDTGQLLPAKWWDFVTVFADNLSSTVGRKIRVYYQVSDGSEYEIENLASNWTFAEEITAGYNNTVSLNVQGRRIRFMFLLMGDGDSTPILHGYTCNYISKDDDAESWQMAISIKDIGYEQNGLPEDMVTVKEKADILNYWARTVKPLTMRCEYPLWDNREVQILRPGLTPIERSVELKTNFYASLTILGMEEPSEDPPDIDTDCPLDAPVTGPFAVTMSGTIQPDQTTGLSGTIVKTIRTAQHTNITTYAVSGTFYDKDVNGAWQETLTDDFYDVYARDRRGNIVAVGVHDAVVAETPGVRTGTFTTLSSTKIASVEVHIHGTAFRPLTAVREATTPHWWMDGLFDLGDFHWGYTEYGVWASVIGTKVNHFETYSGWQYLLTFWEMTSRVKFGEANQYNGQDFVARQVVTVGAADDITAALVKGYSTDGEEWTDDFEDFQNSTHTTTEQASAFSVGLQETPLVQATYSMYIPDYSFVTASMNHLLWVNFPPTNKITMTGLTLSNVCP